MREILFRGKEQLTDRWVRGDFSSPNSIKPINKNELEALVEPETVGQYTGLTDKNGKKIFEGDILSDGDDTYKVVFDEGAFWIENSHYTTDLCTAVRMDKIDEVIGNIHDNPELLEVEE